jgi:hypothetical protein
VEERHVHAKKALLRLFGEDAFVNNQETAVVCYNFVVGMLEATRSPSKTVSGNGGMIHRIQLRIRPTGLIIASLLLVVYPFLRDSST